MTAQNSRFRADLSRFVRRSNVNLDLVVRKVALDLLTSIVRRSPVDTGRFRGNWFVQAGLAPQTTETDDKSGSATISKGASEVGRFKVGDQLFILNHLPYAIELENGHSKQAPSGMVKITALEFAQHLNRAAGGLRA